MVEQLDCPTGTGDIRNWLPKELTSWTVLRGLKELAAYVDKKEKGLTTQVVDQLDCPTGTGNRRNWLPKELTSWTVIRGLKEWRSWLPTWPPTGIGGRRNRLPKWLTSYVAYWNWRLSV